MIFILNSFLTIIIIIALIFIGVLSIITAGFISEEYRWFSLSIGQKILSVLIYVSIAIIDILILVGSIWLIAYIWFYRV